MKRPGYTLEEYSQYSTQVLVVGLDNRVVHIYKYPGSDPTLLSDRCRRAKKALKRDYYKNSAKHVGVQL